jgi:hypothetical protein
MRWLNAVFALCLPSLPDLFFLVGLFGCLLQSGELVSSDGEPARQLRMGQYILASGTLPREELFLHPRSGATIVPYEWLATVVNAASYQLFGLAGLALVYGSLIGLTLAVLFAALRSRGHGLLICIGIVLIVAATTEIAWVARPHVYTQLGVVLCWAILDAWHQNRAGPRRLWLLPPIFCLWANLHGGFLFGWMLLGAYFAADGLRWIAAAPEISEAARNRMVRLALPALASVLAVGINPNGFAMFGHIFGHLGNRYTLERMQEFHSPDFHTEPARMFLFLLLGTLAALLWSSRRPALQEGMLVLAFTLLALYSIRNVPLFALVVAPTLAAQLEGLAAPPGRWGMLAARIGTWLQTRTRGAIRAEARALHGVSSAVILISLAILANNQKGAGGVALGVRFDPALLPVAAADHVAANLPAGNGFNTHGWGGYLAYRLWPRHQVFMHGKSNADWDDLTREYYEVVTLADGWREVLDRYRVQWVLFNSHSPLVQELRRSGEWRVVYEDPLATVLVRPQALTHHHHW